MEILTNIDEPALTDHCARKEFFWLDLIGPSDDDVQRLGKILGLHPLAVEDTLAFGQRPKLDVYDDQALLVLQGGTEADPEEDNPHPLEEIHCYISGDFVVTIRRNEFEDLSRLRTQLKASSTTHSEQYYVYRIIDTIVDTFFPVLAGLDDEINDLEDAIVARPSKAELVKIFGLKRLLLKMRKAVTPMRDLFAREIETIADLAGLDKDSHDYFRDVYDHLIRITDLLDTYHDLVSGCTDLYMSNVANRQGEVGKQLTVVASVFLPLSFLTGFFGMNFDWIAGNLLHGAATFFIFGLGTMVLSAVAMWAWFKHKGWIGED
ncbi:magnesium transport protein CorA [Microlunatus endophyticus]|uniref:Magnesium transport protein CorA n=1 Tax=Microlunatus endophyticus TaxID=1716077 RepID=A0A917SE84_9ACTN|nr:magnesium/cobalt transporter CorA [Microlunatus endophyticus]GGL71449.1 magnesium transport protein CorA [Microlunatus endophyticus]